MRNTSVQRRVGAGLTAIAAVWVATVWGCGEAPKARDVEPVVRDVPAVLRGTIGSEATITGVEPVLVSGYGVVVGLNGTGGGALPVQVQATMERELSRGGIGKGGPIQEGPLAGMTPRQMLRDPNVAVVIVEGVIMPGAPKGARFDVRVRALPGSSVTSLEGGTLWTTVLNLGPVSAFGQKRTHVMAEASGPVFINPFADPAAGAAESQAAPPPASAADEGQPEPREERSRPGRASAAEEPSRENSPATPLPAAMVGDGVSRTVGRVLSGGVVTKPLRMLLRLDNPSHARAMSVVQAINTKFPPGASDLGQTARGRDNVQVEITVPQAYREKSEEFLQLLRFLQIDQTFPQEYAKRYADELKKQPSLADELAWCLQSVGKAAIPFVQPLYEDTELLPRMAALRAGAKLGDGRATGALLDLARSGPVSLRSEAISLLGGMGPDGRINLALRELADAPELEVRVAAYEALLERGDASAERQRIGKFTVDLVQAKDELIYVKQSGEPRIVLFGTGMKLRSPSLATAWSDRLMVKVGDQSGELSAATPDVARLYYRDYRTERVTLARVERPVIDLIRFLAAKPTPENPEPGLGLTYSEIVGALYAIQKSGSVGAAFATERDRLLARLVEAQDLSMVEERPENEDAPAEAMEARMKPLPKMAPAKPVTTEKRSLVVPLSRPKAP